MGMETCEVLDFSKSGKVAHSKPAMSNPNRLLSQYLCHYPNQGRTLNDILMRAAH